jgi:hypothetical protein
MLSYLPMHVSPWSYEVWGLTRAAPLTRLERQQQTASQRALETCHTTVSAARASDEHVWTTRSLSRPRSFSWTIEELVSPSSAVVESNNRHRRVLESYCNFAILPASKPDHRGYHLGMVIRRNADHRLALEEDVCVSLFANRISSTLRHLRCVDRPRCAKI